MTVRVTFREASSADGDETSAASADPRLAPPCRSYPPCRLLTPAPKIQSKCAQGHAQLQGHRLQQTIPESSCTGN